MKPFGWNEEKLEKLRKLNAKGLSDKEIGERFGLSQYTIRERRIRLGLRNAPRRPFDETKIWTKKKEQEFKELFFNGIIISQIAKRLGISEHSIYQKALKNGWKRPHPGRGGKRKKMHRVFRPTAQAPQKSHFEIAPTKTEIEMHNRLAGRCKTLKDFSKKEIAEMERLYGAR